MQVKIVSWNIWIDSYFDQVKDFLNVSNADIIGLQEVKGDDPDRDIIGQLKSLGYKHLFAPVKKVFGDKTYNDGPAIFSKFNILSSKIFNLSENNNRVAIEADIEVGDTTLHVFSTHLVHTHQQSSETQEAQVENLIKVLPADHTIVMGDFNATPESKTVRKIKEVLADTDSTSAPTWSMYLEGCLVCKPQTIDTRLDYIFVSKDLKNHSFRVEKSGGSDHLPISVMIEI